MKLVIDNYEFELRKMASYSDRYIVYVNTPEEEDAYSKIAYKDPDQHSPKMYTGRGIRIFEHFYAPQLILK
jgi:hypothetical protein